MSITGVAGLNDTLGKPSIRGACTTCHDTPNVGSYSAAAALNVSVSDAARRTADLPLFTLRCATTGQVVKTTDPGRALVTGKCHHDGSAATLANVVEFYDRRFQLGLTGPEMADLVAFLRSL